MATRCAVVLAMALRQASAVTLRGSAARAPRRNSAPSKESISKIVAKPMRMYATDCSLVSTASKAHMPGAGINDMTPFESVYKDGFYNVDCVDDYMFKHGDKFGDNKYSYEIGELANVSIVHYSMHVAKEDRQPMTPEVCFSFCRTVPDMTFFGIVNGNQCYCTPYFQSAAGDDTMCDVVCEGNPTVMCGSKTKSSIFGMHMCSNTATEITTTKDELVTVETSLTSLAAEVSGTYSAISSAAEEYQGKFGAAADPVAADLMQSAKVAMGVVQESLVDANATLAAMGSAKTTAGGLADFDTPTGLRSAEASLREMQDLTTEGVAAVAKLTKLSEQHTRPDAANGTSAQYYPVMYFVDKDYEGVPTTCGGKSIHSSVLGTKDECAQACNDQVNKCVGYSFFGTTGDLGVCFFFSKFESAVYYTNCSSDTKVQCMAKLSKFEGTTLAPDGSGKCEQCLKTATKADRCYE